MLVHLGQGARREEIYLGKKWFLVTMTSETDLLTYLNATLNRATAITAYFPADPELEAGRNLFCTLPGASVAEWEGMANCVMVTAPLDNVVREVVRAWLVGNDLHNPLWQYELRDHGDLFCRVEDFAVHMLCATQGEVEAFQRAGLDTSLWEPIQLHTGLTTKPLTDEEIQTLRDNLKPSD